MASVTHGATQNGPPKKTQPSLHAFFGSTAIGTAATKRKTARDCDAGLRAQAGNATDVEEAKAARVARVATKIALKENSSSFWPKHNCFAGEFSTTRITYQLFFAVFIWKDY